MKRFLLTCLCAGALAAIPVAAGQYDAGDTGKYDADNTGKNVRDRDDRSVTPGDQGGSAGDRELTANIRKAIVDDDSLSTYAHNVKIITNDGVVTLRGPVESEKEKATIVAKAQHVPGVKRVDNQLEVEHD